MVTADQFVEARDNCEGYCTTCDEFGGFAEPDAEEYTCDMCDEPTLYGIEQALIMGLLDIE